jgi:putative addiction module component (TIGR02574 family)
VIWDSVADEPQDVPVTRAQREELDRRLAAYAADGVDGEPWETVQRELL